MPSVVGVWIFSGITQYVKCSQNSLGLNGKVPYLSLEKENSCAVFTSFVEWAREIRKFHVGKKGA